MAYKFRLRNARPKPSADENQTQMVIIMSETNGLPERKIIRLQNYDYSQNGMYYITICTHEKQQLFGYISQSAVILNIAGKMVDEYIFKTESKFENINIIEHIVMSNHIHVIVAITNYQSADKPRQQSSIQDIIHWFKSKTALEFGYCVKNGILQPYNKKMWQRSYYEHIIRNDQDLIEKRLYIQQNPLRYELKNKTQT